MYVVDELDGRDDFELFTLVLDEVVNLIDLIFSSHLDIDVQLDESLLYELKCFLIFVDTEL